MRMSERPVTHLELPHARSDSRSSGFRTYEQVAGLAILFWVGETRDSDALVHADKTTALRIANVLKLPPPFAHAGSLQ